MKKIYSIIFTTLSLCIFVGLNSVSAQAPNGFTTIEMNYSSGTFDNENSWTLVDEDDNVIFCQGPFPPAVTTVAVPNDVEITLRTYDSFGDSWNGASLSIVAAEDASAFTNGCGANGEVLIAFAAGTAAAPVGSAPCANNNGGFQTQASFTVQCVSCEVTCPADIVVSNDAGECGAEVDVPSPIISENCTDMVLSDNCEEFSAEGDLEYEDEVIPGLGYLTGGNVDITNVPSTLPGPLASIEVEICVSGDFGSTELEITPIFDENGALVGPIGDELEGDCSTYCIIQVLNAEEYAGVAQDGTISYSIGANQFVSDICASQTITASLCIPEIVDAVLVVNDYNNTDDASDFYPVGVTEVTFTSQDVNGTAALCTFTVTVNDTEAPELDCPSDVTISLAAGDCEEVFTAAINASDNCGIIASPAGDPIDVAGPFGTLEACAGNDGFTVACNGGNTSVIQEVDLSALNGQVAFLTEGCFIFDNAAWGLTTGTVRLYCKAGGAPPSFLTGDVPVATGTFNAGGTNSGDVFCAAFDTPYLVDGSCGGTLWLEVDPNGVGGIAFMGEECNGVQADGSNTYLASNLCGSGYLNQFGFGTDAFFGYTAQPANFLGEADVPGANEFALGESLPIGEHLFAYEVSDEAGNITSCQFTVTVNEFPEELQTDILSCNGSINISVDEACTVVLNADQFLEGGFYGCYESDYQINIWPFNDQSAALNNVGGGVIDFNGLLDAQHTYEIVDLDTGNKCWGNFVVEDKIAPTIACEDLTLQCTDPTEVGSVIPGGLNTYADEPGTIITTVGGVTYESEFNAIGGAVTDITVDLDITHTWIGDLVIDLVSPAGTEVTLFDGCVTQDDIVASFADGAPAFNCNASATGATYAPLDALSTFNGENASGTWVIRIEDTAFGDGGSFNSFAVNITDAGTVVGGAVASDNCDGSEVVLVSETVEEGDCTDEFASVITRVWTAVDGSGNESEACTQTINVLRETLATLELPLNYDGLGDNNDPIECDAAATIGVDANGYGILDPAVYGSPSGVGACGTIISYYSDLVLPICTETCADNKSTYKVVRQWTILDWCTGEILEPVQILKVMDTTAPVLSELANITVGTDIWGCGATIPLPVAAATDNCSETITYEWSSTAGTYNAQNNTFVLADPAKTMIGAPVVVTATATDCCGNSSTASFNVTVEDQVPPVVVAETTRTVSLTTDGTAKIFAESFDDGSHDGCGPIGFSVKRVSNPCSSVLTADQNFDNNNHSDKVFFCCADSAEPVMVEFRVCDDANMDGINNESDNCNTAMVQVIVQDKLAPALIVPGPMSISCIDVAGIDLSDTDLLDELFGKAEAAGTCSVTITQSAGSNAGCQNTGVFSGAIIRSFTASNAAGTTGPLTQTITVLAGPDNVLTCDRISFADLNNNVYNWCSVNDNQNNGNDDIPALVIDCADAFSAPELDIDINGLCTEAGVNIEVDTFQFAGGACKKFLVHYEVIDQCLFDDNYVDPTTGEIDPFNSDNGYFEFYLEIDAFDNDAPVLDCEPISVAATSCGGIDAAITIGATDECTDAGFFGYQWRLDAFNDDTIDFPASGWYSTDAATPGQVGLTEFPIGTHRFFWIVSDGCGNSETCSQLVTVTANEKEPTPYCFDGLSVAVMPSTGTVALWANDFDAGSFDNCEGELLFTMVPEQDVDVDGSAQDAYDLSFTGVVQPNGDYGWEFDCSYIENGISAVIEVRIYVTDEDGNWDYCTASLRLDDNFDACEDMTGTVTYSATGKLQTEQGEDVADAEVTVDANFPEFPMTETVTGTYAFDLIENIDYSIVPAKNDNHLNGVTTLDIVMIQKHILGLDLLDSPYQLIAADVNNDCNVTGSDLVQVRKLILGKYPNEQFPSNDSWRFVEADYNFTNPEAPCNFSEVAEIFNLTAAEINDFVATKIGDVNGTAQANAAMTADVRSTENLEFVVVDQTMAAGSNRIEVLAKDFNEVYGFQYTMNFNNVEFVSVEAGALNVTDNNFGLNANGNLLVSFDDANGVSVADDAVLFTIVLNASNNTLVSNAISMNSNGVAAEAYIGRDLEVLGSDVVFRTNEGEVVANAFSLFQNEPNPFNGATVVGFELPATAEATLSVYDVTGKVLYTKVDTYTKGYNTVTLNRDELTATGVLYYKLESGNNVATMKMIIID